MITKQPMWHSVLIVSVLAMLFLLSGCAGMTNQQQRALSGGAIGASGGAIIGAVSGGNAGTGAAIGGAAGLLLGALMPEPDYHPPPPQVQYVPPRPPVYYPPPSPPPVYRHPPPPVYRHPPPRHQEPCYVCYPGRQY